jgi:hypothetical protein
VVSWCPELFFSKPSTTILFLKKKVCEIPLRNQACLHPLANCQGLRRGDWESFSMPYASQHWTSKSQGEQFSPIPNRDSRI